MNSQTQANHSNPFAYLVTSLKRPARTRRVHGLAEPTERPPSKTEAMRQYLRQHGSATASTLALEAGLEGSTGNVMALLKADVAKGLIERRGTHYHWVVEFDEQEHRRISEAIRTLRRAGYTVQKRAA